MKGEVMNDIATVVIEHRNSDDDLQGRTGEFDVFVNDPYEINQRIKQFIRTSTIFPSDKIVVRQVALTSEEETRWMK